MVLAADSANAENSFFFHPEKLILSGDVGTTAHRSLSFQSTYDGTQIRLYASDLVDTKTGQMISSDQILFNGNNELDIFLNNDDISIVDISSTIHTAGSYSGTIFVVGKEIRQVPIIIASPSLSTLAFLIVIAGFIGSVAAWTVYAMLKIRKKFLIVDTVIRFQFDLFFFQEAIDNFEAHVSTIKYYLIGIKDDLVKCDIVAIQAKLKRAENHLEEIKKPTNYKKDAKMSIDPVYYQLKLETMHEAQKEFLEHGKKEHLNELTDAIKDLKFNWKKYFRLPSVWKKVILNGAALFVVFIVGAITIFQQNTLNSYQTINPVDGLILASTGIGIYHIKELISLKT